MKKGWIVLIAVVAVVLIIGGSFIGMYNGLVSNKEEVESAMSAVDVQLKRRSDLIPNLVNTVKGFASHEKEAIDSVTEARSKLTGANTVGEKAQADSELSGALSRLLMVVENYPDLKADANFRQLSDELAGTENRIAVARGDYNKVAKAYNVKIKKFPTSIFAGMLGYDATDYFEATQSEKDTPNVSFE